MESSEVKHKKHGINWAVVAGTILTGIAFVLVIWFFLHGETSVSGSFPSAESYDSVTCEGTNTPHDILDTNGADKTTTRVIATFSNNILSTISFSYSIYLDNASKINSSEVKNRANINLQSGQGNFDVNTINPHLNKFNDRLEVRFYAEAKDLTLNSIKYLLLSTYYPDYTEQEILDNYTSLGLNCLVKKD